MAEIDIKKSKGPAPWVWVAVAVGVLLLVGVIWALTQNGDTRDRAVTSPDTVQDTLPASWDTVPPGR
jgi:bacteriorhodopsin